MTVRLALVFAAFAGCQPPCDVPSPGLWTATGSCLGVARTMTLSSDDRACTVSFADWATATGAEPSGGVIDGATVTLEGGAFEGCIGEVSPTSILGTCADDCAFEFGTSP